LKEVREFYFSNLLSALGKQKLRLTVSSVLNITLHCVRHAQGYHNLNEENHKLHDPSLPFGEAQCAALQKNFPYHDKVTHLVSSPLRRTLYTCLLAFTAEVKAGKKVIALPELQETSDLPCDTGSEPEKLQEEFDSGPWKGTVDLSRVHKGWNDKSPHTKWAPEAHKIEARAREARRWLRDLGMKYGGNADIVVVTHGGFLHYFTEDWTGHEKFTGKQNVIYCV
jgi:broad specificity phosphatase PhoE